MIEMEHLLIALIIVGGSLVQTTVGFGFGMFSIPILLLVGLSAPEAIVTVATVIMGQTGYLLYINRHLVEWKKLLPLMLFAIIMQPVGVYVLSLLTEQGGEYVNRFFGGVILFALALRMFAKPKPQDHVPFYWGAIAYLTCGFLSGASGMAGAPIVMWVMSHRWSAGKSRAMLWGCFTMLLPTSFVFYYIQYDYVQGQEVVLKSIAHGVFYIPVAILGSYPGIWVGRKMSREVLSASATIMLFVLSLYILLSGG